MITRAFALSIRIVAAMALVLVATYYILASIPFSFYHFLQFAHFWWQPLFIRVHPFVLLAAVAVLLLTLRDGPASLKVWIRYAAFGAAASAACMIAAVWRPVLLSYEVASALSFAPLALLAMINGIELAAHREVFAGTARAQRDVGRSIVAAAMAGMLCSAAYFVEATLLGATDTLQPQETAVAVFVSAIVHTAVFVLAVLVVTLINAAAARRRWPRSLEMMAIGGWASFVLAVLIRRSVLTALVLRDLRATILAAALAIGITTFWAALLAARPASAGDDDGPPLGPVRRQPPGNRRWGRVASCALLVAVCVGVLPRLLLLADWGSTIQKLVVFAAWAAVAGIVTALPAARWRRLAFACALAALLAAVIPGVVSARTHAPRTQHEDRRQLDLSLAIDRYSTFDTSLTVLLDVLRPFVADRDFFVALGRAGQVTDDSSLPAVTLGSVDEPRAISTHRPNIFIIVIDSLRPDYLSAYNPAVTFTPAIGAFAADSIVMRHAFTSYAGTALSEPALWAGGLIPRAMYIKPFSPMNNLERLLRLGEYRRYISVDGILNTILEDRTGVTRLDAHLSHPDHLDQAFKFDLCSTLTELSGRLDHDTGSGPVFFFSQPQSLHIRMLVPEGVQMPRFEALRVGTAEFYKPAANVIERLDACFGDFIGHLKSTGRYDDSIIVLTSDHGDAYGDGNRWGHAFYLAPETVRIPLIIHVPEKLRAGRTWDPDAVAMSIDVTPTLFDLLGYRLSDRSGLLGRSLLPPAGEVVPFANDAILVQSSYSRVYGLIEGHGRWMYTADVNSEREKLYDLVDGGPYPKALAPADRLQYRHWLRDHIERLNRFYGRPPQS